MMQRDPKVLDVNGAAAYLGLSTGFIRRLIAERRIAHYKLGGRVMLGKADLDSFIAENKREPREYEAWLLQGRKGRSPRKTR
jgi:excisionase family DNA binding protein